MDKCCKLREEAAICRNLAREIEDAASIAMFLDRAKQLETRAAALESVSDAKAFSARVVQRCGERGQPAAQTAERPPIKQNQ